MNNSLKCGLVQYYYSIYFKIKNCKIEILNGNVYTNCHTIGKLIDALVLGGANREAAYQIVLECKQKAIYYNSKEINHKPAVNLLLTTAFDKDNSNIYPYHYAFIEDGSSIHATSWVPNKLTDNQIVEPPFPSGIKAGASKPGSVVTTDVSVFKQSSSSKPLTVSEYELDAIKFFHQQNFTLNNSSAQYQYEKHLSYHELLWKWRVKNDSLVKDLQLNNYTFMLMNISDIDLLDQIRLNKSFNDDTFFK